MEKFGHFADAIQLLQDVRDGKLEGKEALAKLAATKQFVFHGSPDKIEMLEPRQAISDGKPDGNPGVSAAPAESYELAIFMALIKSAKNQPMRPEGSRNSGFAIAGGIDGRGDMHADRLSYEDATSPEAFGYVYVFTKKDFEPYAEREYRAYSSVKPVLSIRVTAKDLPEGITITD